MKAVATAGTFSSDRGLNYPRAEPSAMRVILYRRSCPDPTHPPGFNPPTGALNTPVFTMEMPDFEVWRMRGDRRERGARGQVWNASSFLARVCLGQSGILGILNAAQPCRRRTYCFTEVEVPQVSDST